MIPITCAMLAKNAERRLKDVLDALAPFDEVLLLDNGSTDRTAEIAAQYPNVSICRHTAFDGFGNMKNRAATLARNDWIFSIDSDEIPTPELIAAIRTADLGQPENIYRISRLNHYRGRPVSGCGWSPDIIPRLYNRTFPRFSDRAVHEAVIIPPNARTATLSGSLKHYSFDSAEGLIAKMQQYSTLFAEQYAHQKRSSAPSALLHGIGSFIKSYLFKRGWQHGADGLTISLSQGAGAYYKYAKLNERNRTLAVSLIITTYNRPDALEKVLHSALNQSEPPQEILIADDGSGSDTADTIAAVARTASIPIRHIWQPDNGFRLAESRNRAIAAAQGEYIVMIDGDMMLHRDFIRDHIQAAAHRTLVQGSRVLLTAAKTIALLARPAETETIRPWDGGMEKHLSAVRFSPLSRLIWNKTSQSLHGLKGCNMGFFRQDALNINGFNNEFVGWGREDSEFAARLYHSGCVRRNLKFAATAYHLWHKEAERTSLPQNDALLQNTLNQKLTRCENGADRFLPPAQQQPENPKNPAFHIDSTPKNP